jgi:hypothetical protein
MGLAVVDLKKCDNVFDLEIQKDEDQLGFCFSRSRALGNLLEESLVDQVADPGRVHSKHASLQSGVEAKRWGWC